MKDDDQNPLYEWCQGDYALDVAPFIALIPLEKKDGYDIGETFEHICGVVIISQTCDIVRENGERYHVAGCALVERPKEEAGLIRNGRRPHLVPLELAPPNTYADLSKPMAIDKKLLALWKRYAGFSSDEERHKFGFAISRKFGNFAFPDEFDEAVGHLKKQAWKRHEKDTELGRIYRSIREIRFHCAGGWDAVPKRISILAVLMEEERREAGLDAIIDELQSQCDVVEWPKDYEWSDEPLQVRTAAEFSAADMYSSQAGDFEYLCQ